MSRLARTGKLIQLKRDASQKEKSCQRMREQVKILPMQLFDSYVKFVAEKIESDHKNSDVLYVYDPTSHTGFSITGVASLLCLRLDGSRLLRAVVQELEAELAVTPGVYDQAISQFLSELDQKRLIRVSSSPVGSD